MFNHQLTAFMKLMIFLASEAIFVTSCFAQQENQLTPPEQNILKAYLQGYLAYPDEEPDKTIRYSTALVDLDGDAIQEVIVYMSGESMCGSGGCGLLVLRRNGSFFSIITHTTITRPPVRVLPSKTSGWHDISVWVQGGGIQPGYAAVLSFDGKSYPSNPSTVPGRLSDETMDGIITLPLKYDGDHLYGTN